jgi:hypothetical protein
MIHVARSSEGWKIFPGVNLYFPTRSEAIEWARSHVEGLLVVHSSREDPGGVKCAPR